MAARRDRRAEVAVIRTPQPRSTHRAVAGASERRLAGAMEVPIEQVLPDPGQPRKDWGYNDGTRRMAELTESVREFGVLQPLLVREEGTIRDGRQRYIIIAGARRRAAAEAANLATVPVVLRGEEAARVRVLQLVENLQRQELSPLDEARAYQELLDLEGLTPPALAAHLHVSAQHVRDRLRVLADQVLADAVERGQISATTARDIKQLPDEEAARLRERVRAGGRLQTADVAEARRRLAAAGVINPKRKVARTPEPVSDGRSGAGDAGSLNTWGDGPSPPGQTPAGASPAASEQTTFVSGSGVLPHTRPPTLADRSEQTTFVPPPVAHAALPHAQEPDGVGGDVGAGAARLAAILDGCLDGESRDAVRALLSREDAERAWAESLPVLRSLLRREG